MPRRRATSVMPSRGFSTTFQDTLNQLGNFSDELDHDVQLSDAVERLYDWLKAIFAALTHHSRESADSLLRLLGAIQEAEREVKTACEQGRSHDDIALWVLQTFSLNGLHSYTVRIASRWGTLASYKGLPCTLALRAPPSGRKLQATINTLRPLRIPYLHTASISLRLKSLHLRHPHFHPFDPSWRQPLPLGSSITCLASRPTKNGWPASKRRASTVLRRWTSVSAPP
ncbi:hypothetical protein BJY59DRAFT_366541 [Rhodotorula toruloides]